jgi:hypothetical protein
VNKITAFIIVENFFERGEPCFKVASKFFLNIVASITIFVFGREGGALARNDNSNL